LGSPGSAAFAAGLAGAAPTVAHGGYLPGIAAGAQPAVARNDGSTGASFRWFGVNGWEIKFGNRTILTDPWPTRYITGAFQPSGLDPSTPITVNKPLIDSLITSADQILMGHGHFDHSPDIPYIAQKTGAQVIGSETHMNMMRALGVPEKQLVTVRGGEYMQFDGYTIEVFPSLHGLSAAKQYVYPHSLVTVPGSLTRTDQLYEGGSFIYVITVGEQLRILSMSTANFIERAISGLEPGIALVATLSAKDTYQYLPRLLRAINNPGLIIPTHWDNWEKPLMADPVEAPGFSMDGFVSDVRQLSPQSQVIVPKFLETFAP